MDTKNLPLTNFEVRYLTRILETNSRKKRAEYVATPKDSFKKPWLKDEYLNTDKIIKKLETLKRA